MLENSKIRFEFVLRSPWYSFLRLTVFTKSLSPRTKSKPGESISCLLKLNTLYSGVIPDFSIKYKAFYVKMLKEKVKF